MIGLLHSINIIENKSKKLTDFSNSNKIINLFDNITKDMLKENKLLWCNLISSPILTILNLPLFIQEEKMSKLPINVMVKFKY